MHVTHTIHRQYDCGCIHRVRIDARHNEPVEKIERMNFNCPHCSRRGGAEVQ